MGSADLSYRRRPTTTRVILHATHTPPSQSNLEAFLRVTGRKMGLLSIGYHFLILMDGKVVSTRPHDCVGSHCPWNNRDSVGVVLAGGLDFERCSECAGSGQSLDGIGEPTHCYTCKGDTVELAPADNFTPAQWEGLRGLMAYLTECYGRLPLVGHSELPKHKHRERQCPPIDMEKVREWVR